MENFPNFEESGYWNEPDFLLGLLVSLLGNKMSAEFGVTLMVRGAVITGTLVSERAYMLKMSEMLQVMMRGSLTHPTPEDLRDIEETFGLEGLLEDDYSGEDDAPEEPDMDDDLPPIRHLHLRDPYVLYPGTAMTFTESPLPILRLRLATIDGWLPGRVNVIDPMDDGFNPSFPGNRLKQ